MSTLMPFLYWSFVKVSVTERCAVSSLTLTLTRQSGCFPPSPVLSTLWPYPPRAADWWALACEGMSTLHVAIVDKSQADTIYIRTCKHHSLKDQPTGPLYRHADVRT